MDNLIAYKEGASFFDAQSWESSIETEGEGRSYGRRHHIIIVGYQKTETHYLQHKNTQVRTLDHIMSVTSMT